MHPSISQFCPIRHKASVYTYKLLLNTLEELLLLGQFYYISLTNAVEQSFPSSSSKLQHIQLIVFREALAWLHVAWHGGDWQVQPFQFESGQLSLTVIDRNDCLMRSTDELVPAGGWCLQISWTNYHLWICMVWVEVVLNTCLLPFVHPFVLLICQDSNCQRILQSNRGMCIHDKRASIGLCRHDTNSILGRHVHLSGLWQSVMKSTPITIILHK